MNSPLFTILALSFLATSLTAVAQDSTPTPDQSRGQAQPIGWIELAKHPLQLDPPPDPRVARIDPEKLRLEADELSSLASSVPGDIAQFKQGKLPKDMADKLKRIEKLSKHLRSELTP